MLNKYAKKIIASIESPKNRQQDMQSFLPAALEIQDTPPSPIGRAIIWAIVLLFALTVLWAAFGKIDIVAVATGKVIPSGRIKTIQPLEIGMITAIHVEEGTEVKQGDPLVTLDSTQTEADETRLLEELYSAQTEWLRATAFQQALESDQDQWQPLSMVQTAAESLSIALEEQDATFQARLLQAQYDEFHSRQKSLKAQIRAREGEHRQAQSLKQKMERMLPLITERADSVKTLYDKNLASRDQHLSLEQERITSQQDLLAETGRVEELSAEIDAITDQVESLGSEYQRNNLIALMEAKKQASALEQEWIKAKQRNRQQIIHAPIAGTIQQLAVHTIGGIVTPAQELMLIVPADNHLEVEAFIQNKDIGFVRESQIAEVKIDTFNFTKYGTIDAELKTISNDAVSDENLGLVYPSRVTLAKSTIQIADKWVNLSPGMAVTVEVKTGKRRIIEFFLSPLLKYKQESIRER